MSKRSKRERDKPLAEKLAEIGQQAVAAPQPQPEPQPTPYRRERQALPLSLDDIRASASRERANVAHTIADLESWSAEIASTIAFLKARSQ